MLFAGCRTLRFQRCVRFLTLPLILPLHLVLDFPRARPHSTCEGGFSRLRRKGTVLGHVAVGH